MPSTVTLRRAAKIRNRLTQHLAELRTKLRRENTITLNIYDTDVIDQVMSQTDLFGDLMARFMAVSKVLFGLRARIDVVNAECGINGLLAERTQLMGQLAVINILAQTNDVMPSHEDIKARLVGAKERNTVATYGKEELTFSCIPQETVNVAKIEAQQCQSRLDAIQDQLESLNANRTVELTPSDLALLQSERLI
jgi:hypothetical protein